MARAVRNPRQTVDATRILERPLWPPAWRARAFIKKNVTRIAAAQERLTGLPLIGGMSSIPSRSDDLGAVLDEIMPQISRLHLFLHGYDTVPEAAKRERVQIRLASRDDDFGAAGKFYGLTVETGPCLYFCFDDDILYRDGHVQRLRDGVLRYGGLAVVGIHGAWMRLRVPLRYRKQRNRHFGLGLKRDLDVDDLGTGTVGFYSEALRVDAREWPHRDIHDIMLSIEAEKLGMPRIALARPHQSIVPIAELQADSLYRQMRLDDSRQSAAATALMRLMGRLG